MSTSIQPQQSTCPSWCTEHLMDDDTDELLAHDGPQTSSSGYLVFVGETEDPEDLPGVARVWIGPPEHGGALLLPSDARALAATLLRAASIAEPVDNRLTAANLGRTLAAAAESAGVTVESMAREVGITRAKMRNRLDGRRPLYLSDVFIICDMLGIKASDMADRAQMLARL